MKKIKGKKVTWKKKKTLQNWIGIDIDNSWKKKPTKLDRKQMKKMYKIWWITGKETLRNWIENMLKKSQKLDIKKRQEKQKSQNIPLVNMHWKKKKQEKIFHKIGCKTGKQYC